jgi:type IV pilus assembly protein PilA
MAESSSRGFTLIELLIVVSIILILAGLAIPDLMKSRLAADQASAVSSLRTITSAEITYSSTYGGGFSSTLADLDGSANPSTSLSAGLIDSVLGAGVKSAYNLYYVACLSPPAPNDGSITTGGLCLPPINIYQVSANPISGAGNGNYYFADPSGVIRQNSSAPAAPADPPLAG